MSTPLAETVKKPKVRLKFIDMARSVAILLMLEGHFVDDSLMLEFRDPANAVYSTWYFIRSFTAPVFLTVTGLIFVYLLLKTREEPFFSNLRIRKGFKRVIELFFWGYLVQWYAFHVLECIAAGILSILIIYGLYKLIRVIPLWIYFFAAGFLVFGFYLFMRELPKDMPWPANAWFFVQNAFHGPGNRAIFPIIPSMGYTMFGAMIGALIHDFHGHVKKTIFPTIFLLTGVLFYFYSREILTGIDSFVELFPTSFHYKFVHVDWLYERMGVVLMELSVLIYIDKFFGDRIRNDNLFLQVGQNTLTIYILHMVLLYGSMSGMGLNSSFHKALGPWQVTFATAGFLLFLPEQ